MNYNLKIYLDLIEGSKVMDIEGRDGRPRKCVVLPIANDRGTVVDSYTRFDHKLGGVTSVPLKHVELRLTAFESSSQEFSSHYFKCDISKERFEKMSEEQQRKRPIVGNMSPWKAQAGKKENVAEEEDW